jgi:hypothetical protein
MVKIDLHMHSTESDGKMSPTELIDLAIKKKILAISITDHDRASANLKAEEYSKGKPIEYVPGIEITITPPKGCQELHMVGLFIDPKNKEILEIPARHRKYSIETSQKIIKKLNDLGYKISFEELLNETEGKHFGRPFIAQILMRKYPDEFPNRKDVFNKLLGKEGKAFVTAKGTSMKKAVEIIHGAGGIAIIAHPWYLGENMENIIEKFAEMGGDGIERSYIPKDPIQEEMVKILDGLIKKYNFAVSGGTDFHEIKEGENEIGDRGLSIDEFHKLKRYYSQSRANFNAVSKR